MKLHTIGHGLVKQECGPRLICSFVIITDREGGSPVLRFACLKLHPFMQLIMDARKKSFLIVLLGYTLLRHVEIYIVVSIIGSARTTGQCRAAGNDISGQVGQG